MENVTAARNSEDFVATGRQQSVRRFIELTALELGWGEIEWRGKGLHEIGLRSTGEIVVRIDPATFDPLKWRLCLVTQQKRMKIGMETNYKFGGTSG